MFGCPATANMKENIPTRYLWGTWPCCSKSSGREVFSSCRQNTSGSEEEPSPFFLRRAPHPPNWNCRIKSEDGRFISGKRENLQDELLRWRQKKEKKVETFTLNIYIHFILVQATTLQVSASLSCSIKLSFLRFWFILHPIFSSTG